MTSAFRTTCLVAVTARYDHFVRSHRTTHRRKQNAFVTFLGKSRIEIAKHGDHHRPNSGLDRFSSIGIDVAFCSRSRVCNSALPGRPNRPRVPPQRPGLERVFARPPAVTARPHRFGVDPH